MLEFEFASKIPIRKGDEERRVRVRVRASSLSLFCFTLLSDSPEC